MNRVNSIRYSREDCPREMIREHKQCSVSLNYLVEQLTERINDNDIDKELDDKEGYSNVFIGNKERVLDVGETDLVTNFPKKFQKFFENKSAFRLGIQRVAEKPDGNHNISLLSSILTCLCPSFQQLDVRLKLESISILSQSLQSAIYKERVLNVFKYKSLLNWSRKQLTTEISTGKITCHPMILKYLANFFCMNILVFNYAGDRAVLTCADENAIEIISPEIKINKPPEINEATSIRPKFVKYLPMIILVNIDDYYEPVSINGKKKLLWGGGDSVLCSFLEQNKRKIIVSIGNLNDDNEFENLTLDAII